MSVLTEREMQVLKLVCEDKPTKVIAHQLGVSTRTVDQHRHFIAKKTNARTAVGVVLWAIRNGVIAVVQEGM